MRLIKYFRLVAKLMLYILPASALALAILAAIGGLFFNLEGSTIFAWFTLVYGGIFGVLVAMAFVGFLIAFILLLCWFLKLLFVKPAAAIVFMCCVVILLVTVLIFITPSYMPAVDLGEIFRPMLDFLNKK